MFRTNAQQVKCMSFLLMCIISRWICFGQIRDHGCTELSLGVMFLSWWNKGAPGIKEQILAATNLQLTSPCGSWSGASGIHLIGRIRNHQLYDWLGVKLPVTWLAFAANGKVYYPFPSCLSGKMALIGQHLLPSMASTPWLLFMTYVHRHSSPWVDGCTKCCMGKLRFHPLKRAFWFTDCWSFTPAFSDDYVKKKVVHFLKRYYQITLIWIKTLQSFFLV